MIDPHTTQRLAQIHQAELLEEAKTNRLLWEAQVARPSPAQQLLTIALLLAAGAGVLFLFAV